MSRDEALALVGRILSGDGDDQEVDRLLEALDRAFGCPTGYVSDLIYWPDGPEPTAEEVVDKALAYRPIAL